MHLLTAEEHEYDALLLVTSQRGEHAGVVPLQIFTERAAAKDLHSFRKVRQALAKRCHRHAADGDEHFHAFYPWTAFDLLAKILSHQRL